MNRLAKNEEIRARVDRPTKRHLEELAFNERLDMSDILRRAIYQYLQREAESHGVLFPPKAQVM